MGGDVVRLFFYEVFQHMYICMHGFLNKFLPISFGQTTMWDPLVYILVGAYIRYNFTIARVLILVFTIKWL